MLHSRPFRRKKMVMQRKKEGVGGDVGVNEKEPGAEGGKPLMELETRTAVGERKYSKRCELLWYAPYSMAVITSFRS